MVTALQETLGALVEPKEPAPLTNWEDKEAKVFMKMWMWVRKNADFVFGLDLDKWNGYIKNVDNKRFSEQWARTWRSYGPDFSVDTSVMGKYVIYRITGDEFRGWKTEFEFDMVKKIEKYLEEVKQYQSDHHEWRMKKRDIEKQIKEQPKQQGQRDNRSLRKRLFG